MKVFILGRHEVLWKTFEILADSPKHQIVGVVTAPACPEYEKTEKDFATLAAKFDVPFRTSRGLDSETLQFVREQKPDICISLNWVGLITESATAIFPLGILNAHFGDLPNYRGNAVTNWAILAGESQIALTIHRMIPGALDCGEILAKKYMALSSDTTIRDINKFAEQEIPGMFCKAVDQCAEVRESRTYTREEEGFRCYPRLPEYGNIIWSRPADEIHALVRSLTKPYSGAYSFYRTKEDRLKRLRIWKTRVVCSDTQDRGVPGHVIKNDLNTGESWIFTGKGILALVEVSHDEEKEILYPGKMWKTIRMHLGMDVEEEIYRILRSYGS